MMALSNHTEKVNFIFSIADSLRGPYEIPLNRHFYVYEPPRPLEEIEAEVVGMEPVLETAR